MAQLLLRDIDDEVTAQLRLRALSHGRSAEEEARAILSDAVGGATAGSREIADGRAEGAAIQAPGVPLGSRLAKRFAGLGLVEGIAEVRDQPARPADVLE